MGTRKALWIVLLIMSICICGVGAVQTPAAPEPATALQWEYQVVSATSVSANDWMGALGTAQRLNALGRDGWELIACEQGGFVLKRPLPLQQP